MRCDALEASRWPQGFSCPGCGNAKYCLLKIGKHKNFQCKCCRLQTSLIALGVSYSTAWLIQQKLMQARVEREMPSMRCVVLSRPDDTYLCGELAGRQQGRPGSENKVTFVAAISLSAEGRTL
jgi:hypothetical protein